MKSTVTSFSQFSGSVLEQVPRVMEYLFAAASPDKVFSQPVVSDKHTVILASEVHVGGGFGSGMGLEPTTSTQEASEGMAGGGGLGGGGGSMGRPVAVIVIGPDGVKVEPIVDVTRLVLSALSAWGALWAMVRGWRRLHAAPDASR